MGTPGDRSRDEANLAVFCDFENLAIGARDAGYGDFRMQLALERMLEKGRVLIKRAYSDWKRYSDYRRSMHEYGFELIEIPHVSYSGKNSADIHLVVDALDLCYTREHIDVFVIMSGDSDFSPLVRKLRENDKRVVGMGVKGASSDLLVESCDEFIYYDDLVRRQNKPARPARSGARPPKPEAGKKEAAPKGGARAETAPKPSGDAPPTGDPAATAAAKVGDVEEAFDLVLDTVEALFRERDDEVHGAQVKQALKRKRPTFDEAYYGFRTFSQLLESAAEKKLLELREADRGGGYVVVGFGEEA